MQFAGGLVLATILLAPPPKAIEGVVVQVTDTEVVVDLGTAQGLRTSAELALFRRLVVTHPITGKKIEDRFPMGRVRPAQIGELLTIIRKTDHLTRAPKAGDFAVYNPPPPTPMPSMSSVSAPATNASIAVLDTIFRDSLGKALPDRIKLFESYLQAFPQSKYAQTVGQEVVMLRRLLEAPKATVAAAAPTPPKLGFTIRGQEVRNIIAGDPFELAIAVVERERITLARLLVGRGNSANWRTINMLRAGDFNFRAALPPDLLAEPGRLSYFIEAVTTDNKLVPLWGTSAKPKRIRVLKRPPGEGAQGASLMEISAQYVDFNTSGEATDSYLHWEVSFAYEVNFDRFSLLRVGLGTIDGEGGDTELIDVGHTQTRQISVNYAFAEGEFALSPLVGAAARIIGGSQHQGIGTGTASEVSGFEGRLRFGTPLGTRLVVGGGSLEGMGAKAFSDVFIEVFENVPIRAAVTVTDLPVGANLGVQLSTQVGYRLSKVATLHLKAGWNARTIRHYGFTGGTALTLGW